MTRLSLLVDLASSLAREVDLDALLRDVTDALAEALRAERATVWLVDAERGDLVARVGVALEGESLRLPLGKGIAGHVARTGESVRIDDAARDPRFDPSADEKTGFTTRSVLAVPIREGATRPVRGVVQVLNRVGQPVGQPVGSGPARHDLIGCFDQEDERYLQALGIQLGRALAMTTLRADDESGPGLSLRGPFNRIVGRGAAMDPVYERIGLCASTDATVLLRGETGTGKTLLARAIHVNSPRRDRPFVTVDCTTLPGQLVESELFGHERGAFTGADRRVAGKVELAAGGTLFLDEIGDLPLSSQAKLLRFLQDRTFERVGGRETITTDCRILCATHHDLEAMVEEGRFRRDLYYRVRVVPIEVPRLADRGPEDLDRLARHFATTYAERYGRPEPTFTPDALEALSAHSWPGNVRELEHWIEGAIVLSPDAVIEPRHFPERLPRARSAGPRSEVAAPGPAAGSGGQATGGQAAGVEAAAHIPHGLTAAEARDAYVRATLEHVGGNKSEAARRLGVSRNTVAKAAGGDG